MHIVVDDAIVKTFGRTREELAAMTLGQFFEMVTARGYDVEIGPWRETSDGSAGFLRLKMADERQAASQ